MADQSVRVTIAVPVFNGENYLPRALDSLCRQSLEDVELLISDNASTDGTRDICQAFAARDERIRYVRHRQNFGASFNANFTIAQARGEYFKLSSHDDEAAPAMLERCVAALDADPSLVLCYPRTALVDGESRLTAFYHDCMNLSSGAPHRRLYRLLRVVHRCNPVFGVVRTRAMQSTRGFPPYLASDAVALAELALRGRFLELRESLFLRRMHAGISSRSHHSPVERLFWFDPYARRGIKVRRPSSWLNWELARAILRAPLPATEKRRCLAVLHRTRGTGRGARSYQRRVEIDRRSRDDELKSIRAQIEAGHVDAARERCERCLADDVMNPVLMGLRAVVALFDDDYERAEAWVDQAVIRARHPATLFNLQGVIRAMAGRTSEARESFARVLDICPDAYGARHNLEQLRNATAPPALSDLMITLPA